MALFLLLDITILFSFTIFYKIIQVRKELWRAVVQPPVSKKNYCLFQQSQRIYKIRS